MFRRCAMHLEKSSWGPYCYKRTMNFKNRKGRTLQWTNSMSKVTRLRLCTGRRSICGILSVPLASVVSCALFQVTHLVISKSVNFKYRPGDYIFLQIPAIAKHEWHPFTISSAPEMQGMPSAHDVIYRNEL